MCNICNYWNCSRGFLLTLKGLETDTVFQISLVPSLLLTYFFSVKVLTYMSVKIYIVFFSFCTYFKGCVRYIFASLFFLSLKMSTCKTRKNAFYFNLKALVVHEKIKCQNFRFSSFMTPQMPKHKTNTFYWISWEENTVC